MRSVRFFEAINRWQIVAATVVIMVGIDLGIFSLSHLPDGPPPSAPLQGQSLAVPVEDTTPSEAQYRP